MMASSAAISQSTLYSPYGVPMTTTGAVATNLGFTGEHTDPSGLQYLRARYYDPRTAAFLSRDPALGVYPTLSGSWNGYTYAHGNPIMYTDPSGRCIFFGGIDTALCAAAGLFLAGGAIDVGAQMLFEGRSIHQIDKTRAAISGATTVIGGGAGFASGALIRSAGLSGARALAVGGAAWAADIGTGIAADHYLLGDSWGTAILGNAFGFGLGEVAGYAAKGFSKNIPLNSIQQVIDSVPGIGPQFAVPSDEYAQKLLHAAAKTMEMELPWNIKISFDSNLDDYAEFLVDMDDTTYQHVLKINISRHLIELSHDSQLLTAGHELMHYLDFDRFYRDNYHIYEDLYESFDAYMSRGMVKGQNTVDAIYAWDEIMAETTARVRLRDYLGRELDDFSLQRSVQYTQRYWDKFITYFPQ